MNRNIILGILALLFVAQSSFGQNGDQLKIMTYNIWNGFDWGKDLDRKANVVEFIRDKKPDVMALQELNQYTQEKLEEDAKKWGHEYALLLKISGYSVGITSNRPIDLKERVMEGMHHGALFCSTQNIDFMVVHLSPFSYEKRRYEARTLVSRLSEEKNNRTVVLGDFNALSPFDAHLYKGNKGMIESNLASEKEHAHVRNLVDGNLEFDVLSHFLSFPLVDVVQRTTALLDDRVSCPTQVFEDKKGEGRNPNSTRIDYILTSPSLAKFCVDAKVLNKEETYYLSDHYPVVAEFDFSKFPEQK